MITVPLIVVIAAVAYAAVRYLNMRPWVAFLLALVALYLSHTSFAPAMHHSVRIVHPDTD